jgi:mono/diheme cytochrome c family protein
MSLRISKSFGFAIALASLGWLNVVAQTAAKPTDDLPAGAMQAKATAACTECHEARIILQQRLSKAAWTKEVDKMMKWGALVDAADRDALIDYLSTNFSPDQPPYEAPRSATESSPARPTQKKATTK